VAEPVVKSVALFGLALSVATSEDVKMWPYFGIRLEVICHIFPVLRYNAETALPLSAVDKLVMISVYAENTLL